MRYALAATVVGTLVIALQQLGQGNGWWAGLAFAAFMASLSWLTITTSEDESPMGTCDLDYSHAARPHTITDECVGWHKIGTPAPCLCADCKPETTEEDA